MSTLTILERLVGSLADRQTQAQPDVAHGGFDHRDQDSETPKAIDCWARPNNQVSLSRMGPLLRSEIFCHRNTPRLEVRCGKCARG